MYVYILYDSTYSDNRRAIAPFLTREAAEETGAKLGFSHYDVEEFPLLPDSNSDWLWWVVLERHGATITRRCSFSDYWDDSFKETARPTAISILDDWRGFVRATSYEEAISKGEQVLEKLHWVGNMSPWYR